ncbi:MAG TPA: uroporphyrinogen decarboxylase family protein [Verrucomicrobiae bacterium]
MKWYSGENLPATHARPTFSEAWFHQSYGLEFGEKYSMDPVFRTEQDREAVRLLHERFGALGLGKKDPPPRPHLEICGHRLLPALLGCEVFYQAGQPPAVQHLPAGSIEEIASVPRPDLAVNRWAREFRRQAGILIARYGQVDATINHGGPINVASNALGTQAFLCLAEPSPQFRAFLQMIAELCLETYDQLTLPLSPGLDPGRELFIGNCPVMMLDPATYSDEVFPADYYIRTRAKKFGLHHCGAMDRYLGQYKALSPCDYIEVGWGSTVARVREAFPTSMLDLMINIPAVQNMPADRLADTAKEMVDQAAPWGLIRDIYMADIGPDVSDIVVENFVEAVDAAFAGFRIE